MKNDTIFELDLKCTFKIFIKALEEIDRFIILLFDDYKIFETL